MKILWCWRCQRDMPMLETEEAALVRRAHLHGMPTVEAEAKKLGRVFVPMQLGSIVAQRLQPMLEMYRLLTGFVETNPNAVWHHMADQYGAPCPQCHKPLRTKAARFCAACGFGQDEVQFDTLPLVERYPELFI